MQSEQWSRLSLVAALSTVAVGVALLTLYPTPKPLPDRLAKIDEEDVQIDNDGLYADFDWWHVRVSLISPVEKMSDLLSIPIGTQSASLCQRSTHSILSR